MFLIRKIEIIKTYAEFQCVVFTHSSIIVYINLYSLSFTGSRVFRNRYTRITTSESLKIAQSPPSNLLLNMEQISICTRFRDRTSEGTLSHQGSVCESTTFFQHCRSMKPIWMKLRKFLVHFDTNTYKIIQNNRENNR